MCKKSLHPSSRRWVPGLAVSALGLTAAISPLAQAATIDWSGATDSTWATGSNWNGGIAPANSLLTDIANFDLATYANQPDAGTTSIKGIAIGASSGDLTIGGTALSIGSSGIVVNATAGAAAITAPITLGASQTWTNDSINTLTVGSISRVAGSGTTLLFSQTANATPTNYATSATDTNGMLGGWAIIKTGASSYGFAHSGDSGTNPISAAATSTLGTSFSGDNSTVNWINSDGNTTLTAATQVNSFTSANDVTVSGLLTVGSGGVILGNNGSKWIKTGTGGQITTGLASGELFVHTANTGAGDMRLWTQIVDNGATPTILVKDGPGYLGLQPSNDNNGTSIANTYTGGSILNGGTIALSGAQPLGTGAVQLNNATLTTFGAGNNATNATVANNIAVSGNTGFTANTGGNLSLNGTLTGSGNLTFGNGGANASVYLNFTNSLSSGSTITVVNNTNSVRFASTTAGNAGLAFVFNNTSANKNTLDFASGGTISFGSMTGTGLIQGNGAGVRTISAGGLGLNETFAGIVANGSGTTAVTKVGTGTWTLSGANTYTGATTANAGTLQIGNGTTGSISAGSAVSVTSGATLAFNQATGATFGNAIANEGTVKGVQGSGITNTLSGVISGAGGVNQNGSGTMNLSGANTYTGATTINAGTLGLTGAGSIETTSGITVNGATAAFLTSSSTAVTPVVTVTLGKAGGSGGGTLGTVNVANNAGAGILTGAGGLNVTSLTLDGAATFSWSASAQLSVDTFTINSSASSVTIGSSVAWTTSVTPYTILSATTIAGTGAGLGAFSLGDVTSSFTGLTPRQTATAALAGNTITVTIAGDNYPKWTGAGSTAWNTTATNNWVLVNGGAATTFITNDLVLFDDTASQGAVTINDGNVSTNGVTFNNSAIDYTVSGANGIAGGGGLTKSGTGTVTLDTTNSYTGGTTVNAGTLFVTGTLGSGAVAINGGTLQIGNGDVTGSFSGTPTITDNGVLALNRSTAFVQGTDFGVISGTGSVQKSGAGALTLNAANTYSGGTTINGGTVIFGNNSAFGTGAVTLNGGGLKAAGGFTLANNIAVASAATIDMAGNNTAFSGNVTGSAALTFSTTGPASTATFSGDNSGYTGTVTFNNNNAVSFNSANAGSAGAAWVFNDGAGDRVRINAGNGTISFGAISGVGQLQNDTAGTTTTLSVGALGTDTTFSGTMKDNGTGQLALAKVGVGTLTLTGASTYTGATTINGGTLKVNGSLSTAAAVAVNTGALAGTGTVGNVTLGALGIVAPGDGGIGTLTAASLTWQDGHMVFDLSEVDNTSDQLIVQGLYSGAGGTTFTFDLTGGVAGETYTLVSFGSTDFTDGSQFTANGTQGNFTLDTNTNTLTFTATAVPEPGTVALLVLGAGCVLLVARRRHHAV